MQSERKWVAETFEKAERELQGEREKRKKNSERVALLNYFRNFDSPELVLMKLQLSSNEELLRFRNACLEVEKITDADLKSARELAQLREQINKKLGDKMGNLVTERLKEFLKIETSKQK